MSRKHQSYSSEFKESAVRMAIESDRSIAETARELEINTNTLHTWVRKSKASDDISVPDSMNSGHVYDEVKRLRREVAKLKEERAILKKAATFFAKECH